MNESNSASLILACKVKRNIFKTKMQTGMLAFIIVNAASFYDIKARLNKLEKQRLVKMSKILI